MPFFTASERIGDFFWNIFISVRMSLALFAYPCTDIFIDVLTGGCDELLLKCSCQIYHILSHADIFSFLFRLTLLCFNMNILMHLFVYVYICCCYMDKSVVLKVFDIIASCVQVNSSRILFCYLGNIAMMKWTSNQMIGLKVLMQRIRQLTMKAW